MLKRIITSIIATIIFIPILVFSDTWAFPIAMAFACAVGCGEMIACVGQKKNISLFIPICLIAAAFPIVMRFAYLSRYANPEYNSLFELIKLALAVFMLLALYVFSLTVFNNKKLPVTDACLLYSVVIYIVAAFSFIVYIHDYVSYGKYIYLLVFLCAWMTDIFAYFSGRLFGKHKLIPTVSPKKTVEGSIGGVLFCVLATVLYGVILEQFFIGTGKANYVVLAVSAVFISIVSQMGDLIMSVIKRHYGIKDYGKLFPGHGGILDRFDSVMAVSVILAVICTYFNLVS